MTSIYNLRTAMSAPVSINCYPVNDPNAYKASILRRFGVDVEEEGSADKLADLENAAMKQRLQTSPGAMATHATYQHDSLERYAKAREDASKRQEEIHSRIFAALAQGEATARDMARVLDYHVDTARDHLRAMSRAGMIHAETVGQVRIYSLPRAEAAE